MLNLVYTFAASFRRFSFPLEFSLTVCLYCFCWPVYVELSTTVVIYDVETWRKNNTTFYVAI